MRYPILILALAIACHAGVMAWNGVEDRNLKTCLSISDDRISLESLELLTNPKKNCIAMIKKEFGL